MSMKKKKRRSAERRRKRMRRRARLADARQWLPTQSGADVIDAYRRWYGVDPVCAIMELRSLGISISDEYEAQVRESWEERAKARAAKRAATRAERHAAKRVAQRTESRAAKRATKRRVEMAPELSDDLAFGGEWLPGDSWWDDDERSASCDEGEPEAEPEVGYDEAAGFELDGLDGDRDRTPEDGLLDDARTVDLRVEETEIESLDHEIVRVRMLLAADPAVLAGRVWGLIFAIGSFSFDDADADLDFAERDEWTADDMWRGLTFERGRLRFHADVVRDRCMRTTIELEPDGKITLETVNRGNAASEWISRLQGRSAAHMRGDDDWLEPIPF
jgi:hypothetical protein